MSDQTKTGTSTRDALIDAGLTLFAEKGYEGTATREIAKLAGANIGSISYYFGGKNGLRLACAEKIGSSIAELAQAIQPAEPANLTPDQAAALLETMISTVLRHLLTQPRAREIFSFILREFTESSAALDYVFRRFLEPSHRLACALWGIATGAEAESEAARLAVFSMIGQGAYFAIARALVVQRMGWTTLGPDEVDKITAVIRKNIHVLILHSRQENVR